MDEMKMLRLYIIELQKLLSKTEIDKAILNLQKEVERCTEN